MASPPSKRPSPTSSPTPAASSRASTGTRRGIAGAGAPTGDIMGEGGRGTSSLGSIAAAAAVSSTSTDDGSGRIQRLPQHEQELEHHRFMALMGPEEVQPLDMIDTVTCRSVQAFDVTEAMGQLIRGQVGFQCMYCGKATAEYPPVIQAVPDMLGRFCYHLAEQCQGQVPRSVRETCRQQQERRPRDYDTSRQSLMDFAYIFCQKVQIHEYQQRLVWDTSSTAAATPTAATTATGTASGGEAPTTRIGTGTPSMAGTPPDYGMRSTPRDMAGPAATPMAASGSRGTPGASYGGGQGDTGDTSYHYHHYATTQSEGQQPQTRQQDSLVPPRPSLGHEGIAATPLTRRDTGSTPRSTGDASSSLSYLGIYGGSTPMMATTPRAMQRPIGDFPPISTTPLSSDQRCATGGVGGAISGRQPTGTPASDRSSPSQPNRDQSHHHLQSSMYPSPDATQQNPSSQAYESSFPYFQDMAGNWSCKYCYNVPMQYREHGSVWMESVPPPPGFVDQHLSVCRAYHHANYQQQQRRALPPSNYPYYTHLPPPPQHGHPGTGGFPPPYGHPTASRPYSYGSSTFGPQHLPLPPPDHPGADPYRYRAPPLPPPGFGAPDTRSITQSRMMMPPPPASASAPVSQGEEALGSRATEQQSTARETATSGSSRGSRRTSSSPSSSEAMLARTSAVAAAAARANMGLYEDNPIVQAAIRTLDDHFKKKQAERQSETGETDPNADSLVMGEDKLLLTEYFYHLMHQLRECRFSEADRKTRGGKRENISIGYGGLQCVHCSEAPNARKFFWSNVDRLANSFAEIPAHVLKCRRCPTEVKTALTELKKIHSQQMSKLPRGSQKVFFRRMWRRLHDEDPDGAQGPGLARGSTPVSSSSSPRFGLSTRQHERTGSSEDVVVSAAGATLGTASTVASQPKQEEDVAVSPGTMAGEPSSPLVIERSTEEAARALATASMRQQHGPRVPTSPTALILLAISEDKQWLSDMDCFVRQQLEVFCATEQDIHVAELDRKYPVKLGQVGIRCIHCATASGEEARGPAVQYPFSIQGIYESVREFQRVHLESCPNLPRSVKTKLAGFRGSSSLSSVLRKYYVLSAGALGMYDTNNGIRSGGKVQPIGSGAPSTFSFSETASAVQPEKDDEEEVEDSKPPAIDYPTSSTLGSPPPHLSPLATGTGPGKTGTEETITPATQQRDAISESVPAMTPLERRSKRKTVDYDGAASGPQDKEQQPPTVQPGSESSSKRSRSTAVDEEDERPVTTEDEATAATQERRR